MYLCMSVGLAAWLSVFVCTYVVYAHAWITSSTFSLPLFVGEGGVGAEGGEWGGGGDDVNAPLLFLLQFFMFMFAW